MNGRRARERRAELAPSGPRWLIEDVLPEGALVTVADLDDPSAAELLARGFDVVLRLVDSGAAALDPVRLEVHWKPGLVPGRRPPEPIWLQMTAAGYVRVAAPGVPA